MKSRYEIRIETWLHGAGFPPYELQHQFAKAEGRRWLVDVAWPDYRVGVEIDGGGRMVRWQKNPLTGASQPVAVGRHGTATDYEKLNWAAEHGWRMLRFNPDMLTQPGYVLAVIARTLKAAGARVPEGSTVGPALVKRSSRRPAPARAPGASLLPRGFGAGSRGPGSR